MRSTIEKAREYMEKGMYEEVLDILGVSGKNAFTPEKTEELEYILLAAEAMNRLGYYHVTLEILDIAYRVSEKPFDPVTAEKILILTAEALLGHGEYQEALSLLESAPVSVKTRLLMADAKMRSGDHKAALEIIEQVIPNISSEHEYVYGMHLLIFLSRPEAFELCERALKQFPESISVLSFAYLLFAFLRLDGPREEITRKVLTIEPRTANEAMAQVMIAEEISYEKALELVEKHQKFGRPFKLKKAELLFLLGRFQEMDKLIKELSNGELENLAPYYTVFLNEAFRTLFIKED